MRRPRSHPYPPIRVLPASWPGSLFARQKLANVTGRLTMTAEVKLPRLGQGMESGTIVKWLKAEGEPITKGEPLYEVDTEKVTQEVEAEVAGVLLKIAVPEGEVAVGQTI